MDEAATTVIYRGMDRAALDTAYNNTDAVTDSANPRALAGPQRRHPCRQGGAADLRYGTRPRALLDYVPCGRRNAPLFVFIHGGYWQRNDKEMFTFVADGPRPQGINVAVIGYTLAPQARLSEIVEEVNRP